MEATITIDIDAIVSEVIDNLDVSDIAHEIKRDHLDISEIASEVADELDIDAIAAQVRDELEIQDLRDRIEALEEALANAAQALDI